MLQLHTCSSQASSHGCFCHMDHQWGVGQLNPSEDMEMYLFQSHLQLHYNTCLTKRETQFLEGGSNLMVPGASTVSSFTRGPAWGSTIVPSGLWIPSCKKRETLMCWNCCRRSIGEEGENNLILEELGKCLSDLCKLRIADFLAEFHNLCNCSVQQLNSPCAALNWGPGSLESKRRKERRDFSHLIVSRWFRVTSTSSRGWLQVTNWYLKPIVIKSYSWQAKGNFLFLWNRVKKQPCPYLTHSISWLTNGRDGQKFLWWLKGCKFLEVSSARQQTSG